VTYAIRGDGEAQGALPDEWKLYAVERN